MKSLRGKCQEMGDVLSFGGGGGFSVDSRPPWSWPQCLLPCKTSPSCCLWVSWTPSERLHRYTQAVRRRIFYSALSPDFFNSTFTGVSSLEVMDPCLTVHVCFKEHGPTDERLRLSPDSQTDSVTENLPYLKFRNGLVFYNCKFSTYLPLLMSNALLMAMQSMLSHFSLVYVSISILPAKSKDVR